MPDSTAPQAVQNAGDALTDGTGVSRITGSKVLKDLVLDFLLTLLGALGLDTALTALDVSSIIAAPDAFALAVAVAAVKAVFRVVLRWASSA